MFLTDILDFINLEPKAGQRRWFTYSDVLEVYLRNSLLYFNDTGYNGITIANIQVNANYRNKGFGTSFIELVHSHNIYSITKIECIVEPYLYQALIHRGWVNPDTNPLEYGVNSDLFKLTRSKS